MIGFPEERRARADLHVHSRYSDNPSEWYLRSIGAPESFVEPLEVYRKAKARGMDFVTISDHDRIEGALDIAHLPGTFLSVESTVFFPEDGAAIHCLVNGFTEEQFREFDRLRFNIYDFREYLVNEGIFHSVAHPLYRVNGKLTVDQFEKLALLFNSFEGINGMHGRRTGEPLPDILRCLTRERIIELADRHGIIPHGEEPWIKRFTGGSDDHSGLFVACAHTNTPPAVDVDEYLGHLRAGRHEMAGERGSAVQLARGFCSIAHAYYRARFETGGGDAVGELLRAMSGALPKPKRWQRMRSLVLRYKAKKLAATDRVILEEIERLSNAAGSSNEETFAIASRVCQTIGHASMERLIGSIREGHFARGVQSLGALAPAVVSALPFVAAFLTQNKDDSFVADVARRFPGAEACIRRSPNKAWLTDTLSDVNGVSRTICTLAEQARRQGMPLTVVTAQENKASFDFDHKNFVPVASYALPCYEEQRVSFPPFLEMIEYLEREGFSEVILSTPGPVGVVGLLAARLLGLKTCGIYHTDFPEYAAHLTGEEAYRGLARSYMVWFYGQLDAVFVRSEFYRTQLMEFGLDPRKIFVLKGGVDTTRFHPAWGEDEPTRSDFVYAGRISREKNLDVLVAAFDRLRERHPEATLRMVGDGPYRAELEQRCPHISFLGYRSGAALSRAYASSRIFVFPSRTDTFGNAVLEAQASGLPAIVSDRGGPAEIVRERESGIVVDTSDVEALAAAMERLLTDAELRETMRERALQVAHASDWRRVLERLWNVREAPAATQHRVHRELVGLG